MGKSARRSKATAKRKTSKKSGTPRVPGIVVVPTGEWLWMLGVRARNNLEVPPGTTVDMVLGSGGPEHKRDVAIRKLLDSPGVDWLFFLDSDMTPEPKTLLRLLSLDVPIAGALCYARLPPFSPVVGFGPGVWQGLLEGGPFEAAWTGGAALLVRREVLEAMAPGPYFGPSSKGAGGDVDFCLRARAAGFSILIDPNVIVGHIGVVPVDAELAMAWGIRKMMDEMGDDVDSWGS